MRKSGVGVCFVVDVHKLADGSVGVLLRGRERLVAKEFLNSAKISPVGEQMRGEGVTQRMRMEVPVDVGNANVFFDDASHGALRKTPARIIEEYRFGMGSWLANRTVRLLQELLAQRPIFLQGFLGLGSIRNDAFLAALAADAQNAFFLLHIH